MGKEIFSNINRVISRNIPMSGNGSGMINTYTPTIKSNVQKTSALVNKSTQSPVQKNTNKKVVTPVQTTVQTPVTGPINKNQTPVKSNLYQEYIRNFKEPDPRGTAGQGIDESTYGKINNGAGNVYSTSNSSSLSKNQSSTGYTTTQTSNSNLSKTQTTTTSYPQTQLYSAGTSKYDPSLNSGLSYSTSGPTTTSKGNVETMDSLASIGSTHVVLSDQVFSAGSQRYTIPMELNKPSDHQKPLSPTQNFYSPSTATIAGKAANQIQSNINAMKDRYSAR